MTSTGTNSARTGTWFGAAAVAAGLVLAAGCTDSGGAGTFVSSAELRLVSFDSCAAATQQLRTAALDHVGPWGFGSGGDGVMAEAGDGTRPDNMAGADGAAPPPAAAPGAERAAPAPGGASDLAGPGFAAPAAPGAPSYSGTNTHESGVDEPDLVKTDGRRIVTITGGTLRVVDARRRVPTGQISLSAGVDAPYGWQVADLLLHGDRALVLVGEGWWGGPAPLPLPVPVPAPESTGGAGLLPVPPEQIPGPRLLLVDLTGAPRVLSDYQVDGSLIDARAVGPTARVVVRSGPRLDFPALAPQASEGQRLAANRRVVGGADVTAWLPRYQVTTAGRTSTGQVDCTALSRPVTAYSGTSMLTVLTFNLAATTGLGDGDPVSVVADGDTVYGNGASLYVASDQRWRMPAVPGRGDVTKPDERTEIYKFDVSQAGPPRYVAAGAVPGWLVNQYAMSEWEGHLRVATTTTGDGEGGGGSQSSVYTLAERDGSLVGVGSVSGLGRGERIYAVRFAGPVGYVVTFRETDPLYTLDLRDPAAPAVLGELKITGYSAYLHPIDPGQVLGVGQEADPRGVVQGTQISLFDVSDLRTPRLRAKHHIRYGQSEVEFDPHAFLWWPAERVVVVPLTAAGPFDQGARLSYGALVLRVDGGGFTELGLVTHPTPAGWEHTGQIRRSLVIGDTLWTVSTAGLQANALSTLAPLAWIAFT